MRLASPSWNQIVDGLATSAGREVWAWHGRTFRTSRWIALLHSEQTTVSSSVDRHHKSECTYLNGSITWCHRANTPTRRRSHALSTRINTAHDRTKPHFRSYTYKKLPTRVDLSRYLGRITTWKRFLNGKMRDQTPDDFWRGKTFFNSQRENGEEKKGPKKSVFPAFEGLFMKGTRQDGV